MTSIKNSNDQFPVNLVIIDPEKEECIAHCKLSIATKENSILIESGKYNFNNLTYKLNFYKLSSCC